MCIRDSAYGINLRPLATFAADAYANDPCAAFALKGNPGPVSYTHLDVYKRQMVGKYGQPSGFAYPTSKFAVNGLTLSLARELAKHKIRVNAVAPVSYTHLLLRRRRPAAASHRRHLLARSGQTRGIPRMGQRFSRREPFNVRPH